MQRNELTEETLRRLAELRPPGGKVLSLYLDLDPVRFATGEARASQFTSLLDDADRQARSREDLDHDEEADLRADIGRARDFLTGGGFSADGAHGMALFCSSSADLFEAIRLPRTVQSRVVVDDKPFVEPLVDLVGTARWCVLLVNRRDARVLRGTPDRLVEVASGSDSVPGHHGQYEDAVDERAFDHLRATAESMLRRFRVAPFDHLLVGCPQDLYSDVEERLHPYLRERLVGRLDVDVERATPEDVGRAAAPLVQRLETHREREALDRLRAGLGAGPGGRGAAGIEDVLRALVERRVEILLLEPGFAHRGVRCPQCGYLGLEGEGCPADGTPLEQHPNVVEDAIEAALAQSAEVMVVRHHDDLGPLGSVGAVLRF